MHIFILYDIIPPALLYKLDNRVVELHTFLFSDNLSFIVVTLFSRPIKSPNEKRYAIQLHDYLTYIITLGVLYRII